MFAHNAANLRVILELQKFTESVIFIKYARIRRQNEKWYKPLSLSSQARHAGANRLIVAQDSPVLAFYGFTGDVDIPAAGGVLIAVRHADVPQAGDLAADLLGGEFLIDSRKAVKEELRPVVLLNGLLAESHAVYVLCFRHTLLIFYRRRTRKTPFAALYDSISSFLSFFSSLLSNRTSSNYRRGNL